MAEIFNGKDSLLEIKARAKTGHFHLLKKTDLLL